MPTHGLIVNFEKTILMTDIEIILDLLNTSPSVSILASRNRELIISFLLKTFYNKQSVVSSESIHLQLADYLQFKQVEMDEDNDITIFDTYEIKAKKYIQNWTNSGFLTNYPDERGEIFYELSSHSSKTIDWIASLKKEEYIGAESKFKNIFNQLKELVEFSNEDVKSRIQILQDKKLEIEQQIKRLEAGDDIKVFEDYEIIPRFKQITQSAKELISDFKEVEDNFKGITKEIYLRHAEEDNTKSHILQYTFDALDDLKISQQGKSFYAFWSFLLNPSLQEEWNRLVVELYQTLEDKDIEVNDHFLKGMKKLLHFAGQKVYKANDKMADKLSRIIRENEQSKTELTKSVIQNIKKTLIEISQKKTTPNISLELETDLDINVPFERVLTFDQKEEVVYNKKPQKADFDISQSAQLQKLFLRTSVDTKLIERHILSVLKTKSQTTLTEVIELNGGIEKGLPELFGYIGVAQKFKHTFLSDKQKQIVFDKENRKTILIPEVIIAK